MNATNNFDNINNSCNPQILPPVKDVTPAKTIDNLNPLYVAGQKQENNRSNDLPNDENHSTIFLRMGQISFGGGLGTLVLIELGLLAGTALTLSLGSGLLIIGLLILAAHGVVAPSAEDNAYYINHSNP